MGCCSSNEAAAVAEFAQDKHGQDMFPATKSDAQKAEDAAAQRLAAYASGGANAGGDKFHDVPLDDSDKEKDQYTGEQAHADIEATPDQGGAPGIALSSRKSRSSIMALSTSTAPVAPPTFAKRASTPQPQPLTKQRTSHVEPQVEREDSVSGRRADSDDGDDDEDEGHNALAIAMGESVAAYEARH